MWENLGHFCPVASLQFYFTFLSLDVMSYDLEVGKRKTHPVTGVYLLIGEEA